MPDTIATRLTSLLECPVCLEVPECPILVVCANNHSVCGDCTARLPRVRRLPSVSGEAVSVAECPECKGPCVPWPKPNPCLNRLLDAVHPSPRRSSTPHRTPEGWRESTMPHHPPPQGWWEGTLLQLGVAAVHVSRAVHAMLTLVSTTFVMMIHTALLHSSSHPMTVVVRASVLHLVLATLGRNTHAFLRRYVAPETLETWSNAARGPAPRGTFCVTLLALCLCIDPDRWIDTLVTMGVFLIVW